MKTKCDETWNNYVHNCLLTPKELGAEMFYFHESGVILPRLDGYAIVPRDMYEELAVAADCLTDVVLQTCSAPPAVDRAVERVIAALARLNVPRTRFWR